MWCCCWWFFSRSPSPVKLLELFSRGSPSPNSPVRTARQSLCLFFFPSFCARGWLLHSWLLPPSLFRSCWFFPQCVAGDSDPLAWGKNINVFGRKSMFFFREEVTVRRMCFIFCLLGDADQGSERFPGLSCVTWPLGFVSGAKVMRKKLKILAVIRNVRKQEQKGCLFLKWL